MNHKASDMSEMCQRSCNLSSKFNLDLQLMKSSNLVLNIACRDGEPASERQEEREITYRPSERRAHDSWSQRGGGRGYQQSGGREANA